MIYLDHNATTPVLPEVITAMTTALSIIGNPSSVHGPGRAARAALELAREQVAVAVGAKPQNVVFTSGGTEANNMLLRSWAGPVAMSAVEHEASLAALPDAPRLPVLADGAVDVLAAEQFLAGQSPGGLLSIQWANNETGVIHDLPRLCRAARAVGWRVHSDAVQAFGKLPIDQAQDDAPDFISLSAHKLGGPKGVGALVAKRAFDIAPLVRGGGQERGRRGGTENLAGIVGFGVAASLSGRWQAGLDALQPMVREAEGQLASYGSDVARLAPNRLANTLHLTMPGKPAALQLMQLDLAGYAVSSGSACSSGKVGPSHVLKAMGWSDQAAGEAIRVSVGPETSAADLEKFASRWIKLATG